MSNSTKNYSDNGGNRYVIGGELNVLPFGKITANGKQAAVVKNHANPAEATNEEIATKQNKILDALCGVGIIAGA